VKRRPAFPCSLVAFVTCPRHPPFRGQTACAAGYRDPQCSAAMVGKVRLAGCLYLGTGPDRSLATREERGDVFALAVPATDATPWMHVGPLAARHTCAIPEFAIPELTVAARAVLSNVTEFARRKM
jgi:hypothetical protein